MLLLDLNFDVKTDQAIALAGFPRGRFPKDVWNRARHCLVVLVGGKKVYVEPVGDIGIKPWPAVVYVPGEVPRDIGVQHDTIGNTICFRLNEYVCWLASQEYPFDPDVAKRHLNSHNKL